MEVSVSIVGQAEVTTTIEVDPEDYLDYETEEDVLDALKGELVNTSDGAMYQDNDAGEIRMDVIDDTIFDYEKFEQFLNEWRELKND